MMLTSKITTTIIAGCWSAFLFRQGNAFVPLQSNPVVTSSSTTRSSSVLYGIRCDNKYYQLEEREDKETSTTELFLKEDGSIDIGETDGPQWDSAKGTWRVKPGTDDFSMTISKVFGAGNKGNDVGEFSYTVTRTFVGDMTHVGEAVAITGVIKDGLVGEQKEVGFFNMIDGTDVRKDARPDANKSTDKQPDPLDKNDASASHKGAEGFLVGQPRGSISINSNSIADANTNANGNTYDNAYTNDDNGLPFGWQEHFDPAQNRPYYVDTNTGITQWERPQMQSLQSNMPTQQSNTNRGLPMGWEEHFDPTQNRPYYVNTNTGVTQWEYPQPDMAAATSLQGAGAGAVPEGGLPQGWEEHFDYAQNRPYYVDTLRGVSQWERPQ